MLQTVRQQRIVLIFLIYVFTFQDVIQRIISPMKYFDELFALVIVPVFLFYLFQHNFIVHFRERTRNVVVVLALFSLTGFVGFVLHRYEPIGNTLADLFVNLKFFLSIGMVSMLFAKFDIRQHVAAIWRHTTFLTWFLFLLCVLDEIFHIFPSHGIRYGLRSEKLFFSHPTYLAAACIFLLCIMFRMYEFYRRRAVYHMILLGLICASTLRTKALAAVILIAVVFYLICLRRKRIKIRTWVILGVIAIAAAWRQIYYYFISLGDEAARSALTLGAVKIVRMYFPFGGGWASYGSAFSISPYSSLYYRLGLDTVYGLSPDFADFISDTYWPMVFGEAGFIGGCLMIAALIILYLDIFQIRKSNRYAYGGALIALLYLLVSSTSESAFVNYFAIPLAFWIGLMLRERRNVPMRKKKKWGGFR